jgi:hypothetical protein
MSTGAAAAAISPHTAGADDDADDDESDSSDADGEHDEHTEHEESSGSGVAIASAVGRIKSPRELEDVVHVSSVLNDVFACRIDRSTALAHRAHQAAVGRRVRVRACVLRVAWCV